MNDLKEVGEAHLAVVLLHVGRGLFDGGRETQTSHDQHKLIDGANKNWIFIAFLCEKIKSLTKTVNVLLGEVLEMLRHF